MKKTFFSIILSFILLNPVVLLAEDFCSNFWQLIEQNMESKDLYKPQPWWIISYGFDVHKGFSTFDLETEDHYKKIKEDFNNRKTSTIFPDIYFNNWETPEFGENYFCKKNNCSEKLKSYLEEGNYLTISQKYYDDNLRNISSDAGYDDNLFHKDRWLPTSTAGKHFYPAPYTYVIESINSIPVKEYSMIELIDILYNSSLGDVNQFRIRSINLGKNYNDKWELGGHIDIFLEARAYQISPIKISFDLKDFLRVKTEFNEVEFNSYIQTTWMDWRIPQILTDNLILNDDRSYISCELNKSDLDDKELSVWRVIYDNNNFIKSDLNNENIDILIQNNNFQSRFDVNITSTKTIYETFKLNNFPFDKQSIHFEIYDENWRYDPNTKIHIEGSFAPVSILNILDDNEEWRFVAINDYIAERMSKYSSDMQPVYAVSLEVERNSNYYVFKIILPIIILVLVSFSSFFISPSQLESKLTLTVVVFLALIAYIFVVDENIPKLPYMTIMDYFVFISFIFTAIPNLLAIYSYQFVKKNNNTNIFLKRLNYIIPLTYIFIISLILFMHANIYGSSTSNFLSAMKI